MKIKIEGEAGEAESMALEIADAVQRVSWNPVFLNGAPVGRHEADGNRLDVDSRVEIFTEPQPALTRRPTRTTAERVKSYSEELNAALHDLAAEVRRDDLRFEAAALEHEAKALYNRIQRFQTHRRWLGERGLPR